MAIEIGGVACLESIFVERLAQVPAVKAASSLCVQSVVALLLTVYRCLAALLCVYFVRVHPVIDNAWYSVPVFVILLHVWRLLHFLVTRKPLDSERNELVPLKQFRRAF